MLLCGAAKANINPDLPVRLMGYRDSLVSNKIHDDLHVAALYLKHGKERVALLTYDMIMLNAALVEEIQTQCAKAAGMPPRSILTTGCSLVFRCFFAARARACSMDSKMSSLSIPFSRWIASTILRTSPPFIILPSRNPGRGLPPETKKSGLSPLCANCPDCGVSAPSTLPPSYKTAATRVKDGLFPGLRPASR